jgi:hypothetical protein
VFTGEVVAAISGRPVTETCDLISQEAGRRQRLVEAHALRPLADGGVAQYRFRHGLFQTYLVQRLDAIERARLHGHVGRELERIYRGNLRRYPETHHALARHFEAAGMAMQAVEHFMPRRRTRSGSSPTTPASITCVARSTCSGACRHRPTATAANSNCSS